MTARAERGHDLLGIGIGPFNLGLACLAAPLPGLDAVFLDERPAFEWHPGLMVPGARLQVPFLADLVTMADPTSPYSFVNYLKQTGRLYRFYIREDMHPLRAEYAAYCAWAASRLTSLRWGRRVVRVEFDDLAGEYVVHAERHSPDARAAAGSETYRARRLVLGIGTEPVLPDAARTCAGPVVHSADYLQRKAWLQQQDSITIVGSGQSAAEVFLDLVDGSGPGGYRLDWVTRSPRFLPMEYTKLTLEMTSPEYVDYFRALPAGRREPLLHEQRSLYKGISAETVDAVFETLYRKSVTDGVATRLLTCSELTSLTWRGDGPGDVHAGTGTFRLGLRHTELGEAFSLDSSAVVLATGYAPRVPSFLDPVADRIRWDAAGRFDVSRGYTADHSDKEIFVQNAEEHTHGLSTPDLGMGAYRNSVILASVLGWAPYPVEERIAFQEFGVPATARESVRDAAREVAR